MVGRLETLIGPRGHPGLGRDVPPHRQPPPAALGRAARLRGELHDPRQRPTSSTCPTAPWTTPGSFGTGKIGPEAAAGAAPDQLRVQRPAGPSRERRRSSAIPNLAAGSRSSRPPAELYAERKRAANCMDYDDLLGQWARLIDEFPDQRAAQGRMFRHILIDEMQDTNTVQVALVEAIAARRAGQPDGRRRRRPVDLPVPRGQLRQHPQVPRPPPRRPRSSGSRRTTARRPRSSRSPTPRSRTTARASPRRWSRLDRRAPPRRASRRPTPTRRPSSSASRSWKCHERGDLRSTGWPCSIATITTASCSRTSWCDGRITYRSAAGCGSSSRRTSRTSWPTCRIVVNPRDEAAWRRLLLLLPGIGPAKAAAVCGAPDRGRRPARRAGRRRDDGAASRPRARGSSPGSSPTSGRSGQRTPRPTRRPRSARSSQGGYPGDRPGQVRAARQPARRHRTARASWPRGYDSLERLIAELLLAGDVYGWTRLARRATRPSRWSSARSTRPRGWSGRASSSPG